MATGRTREVFSLHLECGSAFVQQRLELLGHLFEPDPDDWALLGIEIPHGAPDPTDGG
jgi:hypothetical protein